MKSIKGLDVIATRARFTPGHAKDVKTHAISQHMAAHDIGKEFATVQTPKYNT